MTAGPDNRFLPADLTPFDEDDAHALSRRSAEVKSYRDQIDRRFVRAEAAQPGLARIIVRDALPTAISAGVFAFSLAQPIMAVASIVMLGLSAAALVPAVWNLVRDIATFENCADEMRACTSALEACERETTRIRAAQRRLPP